MTVFIPKCFKWLIVSVSLSVSVQACLTFCLQSKDHLVYGRNFDWSVGVGALMLNPRQIQKVSFVLPPERPVRWISRYGSLTFTSFSRDMPVGGINEKGLVIECLISASTFPARDSRLVLNELQWIQYHLDTCASVEEVVASARNLRIVPYAFRLHYFLTDASGDVAVMAYVDGKLEIRKGETLPVPVLANRPYSQEFQPQQDDRFQRASRQLSAFSDDKDEVDYAFKLLHQVAQGDYTKWQVVYEPRARRLQYRSLNNREIRSVSLEDFNLNTVKHTQVLGIDQGKPGQVAKLFTPLSPQVNAELMWLSRRELHRSSHVQHIRAEHVTLMQHLLNQYRYVEPEPE